MRKYVLLRKGSEGKLGFNYTQNIREDSLDGLEKQSSSAQKLNKHEVDAIADKISSLGLKSPGTEELVFDFSGFVFDENDLLHIASSLMKLNIKKLIFSEESFLLIDESRRESLVSTLVQILTISKTPVSSETTERRDSDAVSIPSDSGSSGTESSAARASLIVFAERTSMMAKAARAVRRVSLASGRSSSPKSSVSDTASVLRNSSSHSGAGDLPPIIGETSGRNDSQVSPIREETGAAIVALEENDDAQSESTEGQGSQRSASGETVQSNEDLRDNSREQTLLPDFAALVIPPKRLDKDIATFREAYTAVYQTSTHLFKRESRLERSKIKDAENHENIQTALIEHITRKPNSRSARVIKYIKEYEETKNIDEIKAQINAYKTIYKAWYAMHSYGGANFLDKLTVVTDGSIEEYCAIREHVEQDKGSFTAVAWKLSNVLMKSLKENSTYQNSSKELIIARDKYALIAGLKPSLIDKVKAQYDKNKTPDATEYDRLSNTKKLAAITAAIDAAPKTSTSFFSSFGFSKQERAVAEIAKIDLSYALTPVADQQQTWRNN